MALTLKQLGLDKGPKKQRWYTDSTDKPWGEFENNNVDNFQTTKKGNKSAHKRGTNQLIKGEQSSNFEELKEEQSVLKGEQENLEKGNKKSLYDSGFAKESLDKGGTTSELKEEQSALKGEQTTQKGEQKNLQKGNKISLQVPDFVEEILDKRGTDSKIKGEQNELKGEHVIKKGNKNVTKRGTNNSRKGEQLPNSEQKMKILYFLWQKQISEGDNYTFPIKKYEIAAATKIALESLKVQLKRLVAAGQLEKIKTTSGRNSAGCAYKIPKPILELLEKLKGEQNKLEKGNKYQFKRGTNFPTSSSIITTTNTNNEKFLKNSSELPIEWSNIDTTPLEDYGFGKSQLLQLYRKGILEPEIIQDSINYFAFDVKKNNKLVNMRKPPIDFFMGILGKGSPYNSPANYISPEEENIKLYLEKKKELEIKKVESEKLLMESVCNDWLKLFTLSQKKKAF